VSDSRKNRTQDAKWLRVEILRLTENAEENAAEDAENAKSTHFDTRQNGLYEARSETSAHYAKELRRILTGQTWEEALREMLASASSPKTKRSARSSGNKRRGVGA